MSVLTTPKMLGNSIIIIISLVYWLYYLLLYKMRLNDKFKYIGIIIYSACMLLLTDVTS